ncbi:MAG TPA: hypothetical protein VF070_41815 [Streptosporangiaceae bacterium]
MAAPGGPAGGAQPGRRHRRTGRDRWIKGLLIPVDRPPSVVDLPGDGGARFMRALRKLIGERRLERYRITTRWEAWLCEDGWGNGKPANPAVTRVLHAYGSGSHLPGTVVIVGLDDNTGPVTLSPDQVGAILSKTGEPAT